MIIRKTKPNSGVFFAIWPRRVAGVGLVALEWLHWERWTGSSNETYRYRRFSQDRYFVLGEPTEFTTPPDPQAYCKNYRTDGPTPCHYPSCMRRDAHGVERCAVDEIGLGENR